MCCPPEVQNPHDPRFCLNERLSDPKEAGVLGRFISRDPIGHAGGLNLYSYPVNPVSLVDPAGLRGGGPTCSVRTGAHPMMRGSNARANVAQPRPGMRRVHSNGGSFDIPFRTGTGTAPRMVPRYPARPAIGNPTRFNPQSYGGDESELVPLPGGNKWLFELLKEAKTPRDCENIFKACIRNVMVDNVQGLMLTGNFEELLKGCQELYEECLEKVRCD